MRNLPLHTIGYEGTTIDEFVSTLEGAEIDLVIDVRDVPISRKKGFSKSLFSQLLQKKKIDYLHLKGLGDPKAGRVAAREGRYADFWDIFQRHLLSEAAQADLSRGLQAAAGRRTCLLCFERDHRNCHRRLVAEKMSRLGDFDLVHLEVGAGSKLRPRVRSALTDNAPSCSIG